MKLVDDKKIKEIESRVKQYLNNNIIKTKQEKRYVSFFLKNSKDSLDSAKILFDLSVDKELLDKIGRKDFNGFLWVINSSYYSMFYMARALMENEGIKISSDLSVHMVTFDVLVHFFYQNGKLQKKILEDFINAKEEADELLGKEKADTLIEGYFSEKNKRASFTYNTGSHAIKSKAETSLKRATLFNKEITKIIHT